MGIKRRSFLVTPPPFSVSKCINTKLLSTPFCYPLLWPCPKMMKCHNCRFHDRLTVQLSRHSFIFLHACTFLVVSTFAASPVHSQHCLGEKRYNIETGPASMFSWWPKRRKQCFLGTDNDLERNCHSLNHGNNTQWKSACCLSALNSKNTTKKILFRSQPHGHHVNDFASLWTSEFESSLTRRQIFLCE